ncbi:MAG: hypothetical protein R3C60_13430 [Parvularculaceae bacterium]
MSASSSRTPGALELQPRFCDLSYKNVLDRGFALVRKDDGKLARRASDFPRPAVSLVFADGERAAASARPKSRALQKPVQGLVVRLERCAFNIAASAATT